MKNFNTSYVIFYRRKGGGDNVEYPNFNTSYVIFYLAPCYGWGQQSKFQYILCYFLSYFRYFFRFPEPISIHPMLFFIEMPGSTEMPRSTFQYILCYFLSHILLYAYHPQTPFQYILCYFLSAIRALHNVRKFHFNTSYVIFYPGLELVFPWHGVISIHPMLFFISRPSCLERKWSYFNTSYVIFYPMAGKNRWKEFAFQYILCYFLSKFVKIKGGVINISIHPMLFFIVRQKPLLRRRAGISIHPMLFFIPDCRLNGISL